MFDRVLNTPLIFFTLLLAQAQTLFYSIRKVSLGKVSLRKKRPYSAFFAFRLNTKRYGVFLCIQSECRKIPTRITPNTGTFQAVYDSVLRGVLESSRKSTMQFFSLTIFGKKASSQIFNQVPNTSLILQNDSTEVPWKKA